MTLSSSSCALPPLLKPPPSLPHNTHPLTHELNNYIHLSPSLRLFLPPSLPSRLRLSFLLRRLLLGRRHGLLDHNS